MTQRVKNSLSGQFRRGTKNRKTFVVPFVPVVEEGPISAYPFFVPNKAVTCRIKMPNRMVIFENRRRHEYL